MSSCSIRRALLDALWLYDSNHSLSTNTDCDTKPDIDNNMPLPPKDFYTTEKELFDAI
jgi:hypothetical protein